MKMPTPSTLAALGVAGLVALGAVAALGGVSRHRDATDNAFVEGDVTPVGTKVSGYVIQEGVRDHQFVKAGDLLYRIDDADYRARVTQAQAEVASARAALGALDEQLKLQLAAIGQSAAEVRGATAQAGRNQRDHARAVSLEAGGWVSRARTDQVWASREQALADLDRAHADLAAARQRLEVIRSDRPKLAAALGSAEAALQLAEIDLRSTEVRAPADGAVGERQAHVGQYVRTGSVMIALIGRRTWITANLKENQLAGVSPGDPVRIVADAVPNVTFDGVVESLSPATGAQFALLPPDNATGNFTRIAQRVPVRIALAPGQPLATRLRPGMSAKVRFLGS